ncbi:hypothetical protein Y032_0360g3453 [Ancylostoma ceylanicum]|uniref:DUF547 domain-containing protein n=1 Tax=Ancylostoma ceylanicum TaxID=53326 RepID=A0A016RWH0_9BILA|nr:hypothetical protein Y032_0360g3453 [Ancylostoma ceylanicum]
MLPAGVSAEDLLWPPEGDDPLRYSPTWESDEEYISDFTYSDICLNAFHYSDYKSSLRIRPEIIDENSESTLENIGAVAEIERDSEDEDAENGALNAGFIGGQAYSVPEYNELLVNLMNSIFADILTDNNQRILYYKLPDIKEYTAYIEHARNLCNAKLTEASPDERLALFLNVYNMMWIHVTHIHGPPRSIWERRKLMNCSYYQIQYHKYAPHSILDGILRSNRKGLGTLWKPFGKMDGRLPLILPTCERLVHFALNTGTRSTPPIGTYNCKTVREELRENARETLESNNMLRIDAKNRTVHLGKVFKWYANDFGCTKEEIIEWILWVMENSVSKKRTVLEEFYHNGEFEVEYIPYDWTFNGQMCEKK